MIDALSDEQLLDTPDEDLSGEQWERKRRLERTQFETWDEQAVRVAYSEAKRRVTEMIGRQVPSTDPTWRRCRRHQLDLSRLMVQRGWRV